MLHLACGYIISHAYPSVVQHVSRVIHHERLLRLVSLVDVLAQ
jgi:hypothetical protein